MGKKISTTVYLTEEQIRKLKNLHEATKVPIAEYIREGVDVILKKYEKSMPGQLSIEV